MSRSESSRAVLMVVVVSSCFAVSAVADCTLPPDTITCPGGTVAELRDYLYIANPAADDTRASETSCGREVRLRGWWYMPTETEIGREKPPRNGLPTVIYNHGSEDMADIAGAKCSIAEALVKEGFAVFVPHRRGHGKSTGIYFENYALFTSLLDCANDPLNCSVYRRESAIEYLHRQGNDVEAAFKKVMTFRGVNPNKMSLMGHSFGGMLTMFTNARELGQKAAVNISGGAQSWDGDPCLNEGGPPRCSLYPRGVLQEYLYTAVEQAKRPVFFFDTKNDVSILPTAELSHYGWKHFKMRFQAAIYSPVPGLACEFPNPETGNTVACGTDEPLKLCPADPRTGEQAKCGDLAHSAFVTDPDQIAKWMPTVKDFLERYGAR